ncbi:hypothetical protein [Halolamina litorea]|uniref:Carboxypeptidase regulatory-like domain-containing protein n=1 Tax=Halolamina litorea TaxID=1515593 RepID=A0ABD6BMK5_9EURY|nr:hypothetical protein [Halolamina litorea]
MFRVASALACLFLVLSATGPAAAAGLGSADAASPAVDASAAIDAPALQQADGSLSLTVTDGDDPVAGAAVTLYRDGERVLGGETGDDGRLDTGPIAEGSYRVEIRESGYYERSLSVSVEGETSRSAAVEPGSVALSVSVTDARTGDALADATVDVDAAGTVRTGTDGTQTVRVPVNAEVGLVVTKDGYERESLSVAVGESARSVDLGIARETEISLSLGADSVAAGGSVEATVTDAYGDPVAGATILLDGDAVAETGAGGTASVPVETGGEHTVRARAGGELSEQESVTASGDGADGDDPTTEPTTPIGTESASNGTAGSAATEAPDRVETPEPVVTATPVNASSSPFAGLPIPDLPLSGPIVPDLGNREGLLGVLPPIQGSLRIMLVLAGIGAFGLVLSVLREDQL